MITPRTHARARSRPHVVLAAAAATAVLAGCSATDTSPTGPATQADAEQGGSPTAGEAAGLPSSHVHGVATNPADELVYLATHDGLFRYDEHGPTQVGPVIDLMGFAVAGPDHFYASGHPGPGIDLPQPVGLIESTDGGATWTAASRQGESDFHALTATDAGVVGFDGTALRTTSDGTTWQQLDPPAAPYALAASPDGTVLLGTTESGPIRSADAGATWALVQDAPLLQVVAWAGGQTVAGVTPDGTIALSEDAGVTWTERATTGGPPQAVGARLTPDGSLRILLQTADGVLVSSDEGATLAPLDVS